MFWAPRWAVVCLVCANVLVGARPVGAVEERSRQAVHASAGGYTQPYRVEVQPEQRAKSWYGYQTLAVDALAVGMIYIAVSQDSDSNRLDLVGFGTYLLGAPLVHVAHGRIAALPSLGMRVGAAVLFGVGVAACVATEGADCLAAALGFLAFPAVIALDAAVFAYDRVEPSRRAEPQSLVVPFYDPTHRAGMVSWAGTF